ncbi:hypothetical protein SPRG_12486 [Saprolegnia parasitica CBS 223.65]|uniref:Putative auto-transporter adhesin head GIN domain-containing protein n=1 Tax=Saprolegnia parasitica (strain CBS 223.65) TaxID=695850 RepID=A0A067C3Y2_SAPPC|nr:hypothetical protein SPRG_12486 [Saprolegnia parasitica CBS 223.65]KDO21522.1 hypothetical protein SPRG_12486 [Saprolegnia parasitica CBS 223.65]|eukprot:XP_012207789.1 hypothetical protein SPRG_12486 [Saprolegnia parasitica CBS 223.65]
MAANTTVTHTWTLDSTALSGLKLKLPGNGFVSVSSDAKSLRITTTTSSQAALDAMLLATDVSTPTLTVSTPGFTASPELEFITQVQAPPGLFNTIECAGAGDCIVEPGVLFTTEDVTLAASGAGSLLVSTDELLLRYANIEASGSGDIQWTTGRFVAQAVNVNHRGSGAIAFETTSELLPGVLTTKIAGSGSAFYKGNRFDAPTVASTISGAGSINFLPTGVCGNHTITSTGSGNVYAGAIVCDNTDVTLGGIGGALVDVLSTLTTTVTGSGTVAYVHDVPATLNATSDKATATKAETNYVNSFNLHATPEEVIAAVGTPRPIATPAPIVTNTNGGHALTGDTDADGGFSFLWFFLILAVVLVATLGFLKRYMDKKKQAQYAPVK